MCQSNRKIDEKYAFENEEKGFLLVNEKWLQHGL